MLLVAKDFGSGFNRLSKSLDRKEQRGGYDSVYEKIKKCVTKASWPL